MDNVLRIESPNDIIFDYCKKNLEIENPQYAQNKRLRFPTYNIPRRLYWYEVRGNDIIVPFGCLKDIYKLYPIQKDYEMQIKQPDSDQEI